MPEPDRVVEVPLRRWDRWLAGFAERHGPWSALRDQGAGGWRLQAADGSTALVRDPAWMVHVRPGRAGGPGPDGLAEATPVYGVLLIRRAGYVVAVFEGGAEMARKVGSRHIHGRTAAGGWSQQRYARRRANQADEIVVAAAEHVTRIMGPRPDLDFLVTGGDRPLVAAALSELPPALAGLPVGAHLGIGTPDSAVLRGVPDRVLVVQVQLPAG